MEATTVLEQGPVGLVPIIQPLREEPVQVRGGNAGNNAVDLRVHRARRGNHVATERDAVKGDLLRAPLLS